MVDAIEPAIGVAPAGHNVTDGLRSTTPGRGLVRVFSMQSAKVPHGKVMPACGVRQSHGTGRFLSLFRGHATRNGTGPFSRDPQGLFGPNSGWGWSDAHTGRTNIPTHTLSFGSMRNVVGKRIRCVGPRPFRCGRCGEHVACSKAAQKRTCEESGPKPPQCRPRVHFAPPGAHVALLIRPGAGARLAPRWI